MEILVQLHRMGVVICTSAGNEADKVIPNSSSRRVTVDMVPALYATTPMNRFSYPGNDANKIALVKDLQAAMMVVGAVDRNCQIASFTQIGPGGPGLGSRPLRGSPNASRGLRVLAWNISG